MDLKKFLTTNSIDMTSFAAMVGCKQPHVSLVCAGHRRPSPRLALKIERATHGHVTVMELLYPDNPEMWRHHETKTPTKNPTAHTDSGANGGN